MMKKGIVNETVTILDYGCGKGYDVEALKELGYSISGYDKFIQDYRNDEALTRKYDVVTCNYVFNVIEDEAEHADVLATLKELGEKVIISVRADEKAVNDKWVAHKDGYITPRNTFQRFYTEEMVLKYFGNVEFIKNTTTEKIFQLA